MKINENRSTEKSTLNNNNKFVCTLTQKEIDSVQVQCQFQFKKTADCC